MTKSQPRTKSRRRRWLELFFLLAGIAGVGVWAWSLVDESLYQDWSNWAFDQELNGGKVSLAGYLKSKEAQVSAGLRAWARHSSPAPETAQTGAPAVTAGSITLPRPPLAQGSLVQNNGIIGRLEIPRLHLEAVVREGTHASTLDIALGHVAGTALPGQNGDVAVAGHRDRLFRGLRDISFNDEIIFETVHAKFVYLVEGTQIVKPTEVSVLNAGVYPELTLVTCYPFNYIGSAPDRFIVKARQIEQIPSGQPLIEVASRTNVASPALAVAMAKPEDPRPRKVDNEEKDSNKVSFEVTGNHSRQLTPGISIGLTRANPTDKSADGWMWVMPDRRTIWLRDQHVREPLIFYGVSDGRKRELVLTSVSGNSVRGYLLLSNSGS